MDQSSPLWLDEKINKKNHWPHFGPVLCKYWASNGHLVTSAKCVGTTRHILDRWKGSRGGKKKKKKSCTKLTEITTMWTYNVGDWFRARLNHAFLSLWDTCLFSSCNDQLDFSLCIVRTLTALNFALHLLKCGRSSTAS